MMPVNQMLMWLAILAMVTVLIVVTGPERERDQRPVIITYPTGEMQDDSIVSSGKMNKAQDVWLTREVGHPKEYFDLLRRLETADKDETVTLHLNGNGGSIQSMIQIINAIKDSDATVVAKVEGGVYSAHAMIALSCDKVIIKDHLFFLLHHSSLLNTDVCMPGGKDRGISAQKKCKQFVAAHLDTMERVLEETLEGIVTSQEAEMILQGHDVIISGEDMKKRLVQKAMRKDFSLFYSFFHKKYEEVESAINQYTNIAE